MISKVSELLKVSFSNNRDWFKLYLDENNNLKGVSLDFFLNSNLTSTADFFIESILVGEYLNVSEDVFDELNRSLNSIYDNLAVDLLFIENPEILTKVESFISGFKLISSEYNNFYKIISLYNTNPSIDVLFSSSTTLSKVLSENSFDKEVINGFNNFYWTLSVNQSDHFFDESIDYFKKLIDLENSINNIKHPFKHISGISLKLSFLKYKWAIRQITTNKEVKSSTIKCYLIDNNLFSVSDTPVFTSNNEKINIWTEYLNHHYGYDDSNDYFLKKYDELKLKNPRDCDFYELHFLIKYHKDIKKNYINLSKIVNEIESREPSFTNKSLFYKNLNYALNNQFSCLVKETNIDEKDVLELRNKIIAFQDMSSNDNFFVELRYLEYRIKRLNELIKNREVLDTEIQIKKHLTEIRDLFANCEKKINWSENHHNLLFQLPYKESLVAYNSDNLEKIYFASSFLLPLSVEQAEYDLQKLKIEFNNKFNHMEVLESLDKEFNLIKELKNNVENTDKKSIETITIFTAIISFIVGTVSGFKFIDSFFKALIFLVVFSTCLFTFVILVFISTKGFEVIKNRTKLFLGFYTSISIILLMLFKFNYSQNKSDLKKEKEIEKHIFQKIDSLNIDKKLKELKDSEIKKYQPPVKEVGNH